MKQKEIKNLISTKIYFKNKTKYLQNLSNIPIYGILHVGSLVKSLPYEML